MIYFDVRDCKRTLAENYLIIIMGYMKNASTKRTPSGLLDKAINRLCLQTMAKTNELYGQQNLPDCQQ